MKIFVMTSFTGKVDEAGAVLPEFRQVVESLLADLRAAGHEVRCAIEAEGWVMSDLPPEVGAKEDLSLIDNSEIIVGLLSKDISAGLQFELGYALKAGKRVIFVPEVDTKLGWFNQGVVNSGWAEVATLDTLVQTI